MPTRRAGPCTFLVVMALAICGSARPAFAQSAVDGFDPGANNTVRCLAVQPDGKILVGGDFTALGGGSGTTPRSHIGRLNPDGSVDAAFNPGANDIVFTLVLQSDGKILVGGSFTALGGGGSGTTVRNTIGRLNADGTVDAAFNPGTTGFNGVHTMVVQPDGKILVGGVFTGIGGGTGTTLRDSLARLNADGSVDVAFNPGVAGHSGFYVPQVYAIALQADGKIVVGGRFQGLGGGTGATPRDNIGRLNPDGSVDAGFNPGANSFVSALAIQPDGKILAAGTFYQLGGGGVTPRNGIARINTDGSLDAGFNPGTDNESIFTGMALQPDGKILLGGAFNGMGGGTGTTTRHHLGRINADGSLDLTFNPGANGTFNDYVNAFATQPDGKILVGGTFTGLGGGTGATLRNFIGRLYADGTVESDFNPGATANVVYSLSVQSDGKVVAGGDFSGLGGGTGATARNSLGRLNVDGSVDAAFNPGTNGIVYATALQTDGKILVGGSFTILGDQEEDGLGRLNGDGSVDTGFTEWANGIVRAIVVQPDGKILIGGDFTLLANDNAGVSFTRNRIARLNADGSVDASFDPGVAGGVGVSVYTLTLQTDGKILVGGNFSGLGGGTGATPRSYIGRLNADGSVDTLFNPGANSYVHAIVVQPDGKILVGGIFIGLGGGTGTTTRDRIGRLNADGSLDTPFNPGASINVYTIALQADGKILVGGNFAGLGGGTGTTPRSKIGRINTDGSIDATFDPGANNVVWSLALEGDGKVLAGGYFTTIGGGGTGTTTRNRIARLTNTDQAVQTLLLSGGMGAVKTWVRSNTAPEVARVTFEISTNGTTYTSLGPAVRVSGGWQIASTALPASQTLYFRLRGYYGSGFSNGSGSMVESIAQVFLVSPLTITHHPTSTAVVPSRTVTFTATAIGNPSPTVQWQTSTNAGGTWTNIAGATTVQYSVVSTLAGNGTLYRAVFTNTSGSLATTAATLYVRATISTRSDVDGDGLADLRVWRPGDGTWYWVTSSNGYDPLSAGAQQWGSQSAGDVPLSGDIDGDGKTDLIVWRASTGTWYWLTSSTGYAPASGGVKQWGNQSLGDVPMLGDLDGDGKDDLVVWRASTGNWHYLTSSTGYAYASAGVKQWGSQAAGDVPKLADMDGDGKADLVVWRASTGTWFWLTSLTGYNYAMAASFQWGNQSLGDVPMLGDIDGDHMADLIVWRPTDGNWYWLTSSTGYSYASGGSKHWGNQSLGDVPLPADMDGDGLVDLVVWRASTGTWYWLTSSSGYGTAYGQQWGNNSLGDIPILR